jgi:membrane protein implicated in regulation of membrane protease activity
MIKNQLIIFVAVVAVAIWLVYRIRERRKNSTDNDKGDNK